MFLQLCEAIQSTQAVQDWLQTGWCLLHPLLKPRQYHLLKHNTDINAAPVKVSWFEEEKEMEEITEAHTHKRLLISITDPHT